MHKKDQGKLGEALVIAQCLENDIEVFIDFGDNSKVDLILNTEEGLVKVQVKCAGREADAPNSARLYLYKSGPNYNFRYRPDQIDYFALVDMATKRIAWIRVTEELCQKHSMYLRMDDKRHKQMTRFDEYEVFPFKSRSSDVAIADIESHSGPLIQ